MSSHFEPNCLLQLGTPSPLASLGINNLAEKIQLHNSAPRIYKFIEDSKGLSFNYLPRLASFLKPPIAQIVIMVDHDEVPSDGAVHVFQSPRNRYCVGKPHYNFLPSLHG